MENRVLKSGVYRHFKGKEHKVLGTALNSETGEEMVIYIEMHSNNQTYVRPKDMFLSKVDNKKYPKETQKYRFELVKEYAFLEVK